MRVKYMPLVRQTWVWGHVSWTIMYSVSYVY